MMRGKKIGSVVKRTTGHKGEYAELKTVTLQCVLISTIQNYLERADTGKAEGGRIALRDDASVALDGGVSPDGLFFSTVL